MEAIVKIKRLHIYLTIDQEFRRDFGINTNLFYIHFYIFLMIKLIKKDRLILEDKPYI
jgi:hypothetical protein